MNFLTDLEEKNAELIQYLQLTNKLKNLSELDHVNLLKNTSRMGEHCRIFY